MADAPQSIAARIAALKLDQVGRQSPPTYDQVTNGSTGRPKPPPPPTPARPNFPARPALPARTQSSNLPPEENYVPASNNGIGNLPESQPPNGAPPVVNGAFRPALPARSSAQAPQGPALPPRRTAEPPALPYRAPSETHSIDDRRTSGSSFARRGSNESATSVATARSTLSMDRMKAPAYDPATLPALPPKKTQTEKDADHQKYNPTGFKRPMKSAISSPIVPLLRPGSTPALSSRPDVRKPSLPTRLTEQPGDPIAALVSPPPGRREIAPPTRKNILSMGFNNADPPIEPEIPIQTDGSGIPPPIPTNSRPDLSAIQYSKPKINGIHAIPQAGSFGSCLLCRDFSAADNHAAQYPRQSLPSSDLGWLAQELTAPFASPTDKARAIFTWLHHNIEYDTVAFFNDRVRPSSPQSTLQTGLAVCEGYAGLFAALAMKAGLEAQVVGGHGKGYGYSELGPGSPIPPFSAGHAWSVVKIEGGQWKLIDCCWGAGVVNGKNQPYKKLFSPERFTQSNDDFGLDHYPENPTKQFRNDGRVMSWEEYIMGNKNGSGAFMYSGYVAEEGMDKTTFRPSTRQIVLSQLPGPTVRFSFQKVCPHWDPIRCGKGPYYLYVLHLEGLDGTQRNHIPFQTNGDVWWCDVRAEDLGRPGQKARICVVPDFDGKDGRGLTAERYREMKGRVSMSFGFVCDWEVA